MPSSSDRDSRLYLEDMAGFCDRVLDYTRGVNLTLLRTDPMRHDAVLRNLGLIGEAAMHVPAEVRARHPEIPWRSIVATRNRVIHGYLGIDDDTVSSIVCVDVPKLRAQLAVILELPSPPLTHPSNCR